MRLHTFQGRNLAQASARARQELGDDVLIVRTEVGRSGGESVVEITAVLSAEIERYRQELQPTPIPEDAGAEGPYMIALVGPSGAGRTTSIARLVRDPRCFGGRTVGIMTVDTRRRGALQSVLPIAQSVGSPIEVLHSVARLKPALKRLSGSEVVLIDTPPLSPRYPDATAELADVLSAIGVAETHLVLPANIRADEAAALKDAFAPVDPTHLLVTRLDEVAGEQTLTELSSAVHLPIRWVSEGMDGDGEIQAGPARILDQLTRGTPRRHQAVRVA